MESSFLSDSEDCGYWADSHAGDWLGVPALSARLPASLRLLFVNANLRARQVTAQHHLPSRRASLSARAVVRQFCTPEYNKKMLQGPRVFSGRQEKRRKIVMVWIWLETNSRKFEPCDGTLPVLLKYEQMTDIAQKTKR
ncbi:MAG: hypothetical protein ACREQO_12805 [Candidatus Binatia bacterium]